jgi:hypothetical protein
MYRAMGHAIGANLMERYEFDCEGDRLVGNLHLPQGDAHGIAILTGPLTSVKEPSARRGAGVDKKKSIKHAVDTIHSDSTLCHEVTPVHTALRNCARGPREDGDRVTRRSWQLALCDQSLPQHALDDRSSTSRW